MKITVQLKVVFLKSENSFRMCFLNLNYSLTSLGTGMYSIISNVTGHMKWRGIVSTLEGQVASRTSFDKLKKRAYRNLVKFSKDQS